MYIYFILGVMLSVFSLLFITWMKYGYYKASSKFNYPGKYTHVTVTMLLCICSLVYLYSSHDCFYNIIHRRICSILIPKVNFCSLWQKKVLYCHHGDYLNPGLQRILKKSIPLKFKIHPIPKKQSCKRDSHVKKLRKHTKRFFWKIQFRLAWYVHTSKKRWRRCDDSWGFF